MFIRLSSLTHEATLNKKDGTLNSHVHLVALLQEAHVTEKRGLEEGVGVGVGRTTDERLLKGDKPFVVVSLDQFSCVSPKETRPL